MSLETQALDAVALAATNQTIAANALREAIDLLNEGYAATKNTVDADLNLVDNIADIDKAVSTATALLIATKQIKLVDGDNISTVNGNSLLSGDPLVIARGAVEIPKLSYEDRGSLRTPVVPIPTNGDVVNIVSLGHFQYASDLEFVDDDEMVIVAVSPADGLTPVGQWVMSHPSFEWTEAQKMFEDAVQMDYMEDVVSNHTQSPYLNKH